MGRLQKFVNGSLLIYFLFMVIMTPLLDIGYIFTWYGNDNLSRPLFLVFLILVDHLLVWPLSIANFYGIFTGNPLLKNFRFTESF
ncbi:hypothetical protein MKW94_022570, partial [Papaver nudicaule]|nr:hypothetical protein [Papaver nudicaule]